jgi:hypothetical protein
MMAALIQEANRYEFRDEITQNAMQGTYGIHQRKHDD